MLWCASFAWIVVVSGLIYFSYGIYEQNENIKYNSRFVRVIGDTYNYSIVEAIRTTYYDCKNCVVDRCCGANVDCCKQLNTTIYIGYAILEYCNSCTYARISDSNNKTAIDEYLHTIKHVRLTIDKTKPCSAGINRGPKNVDDGLRIAMIMLCGMCICFLLLMSSAIGCVLYEIRKHPRKYAEGKDV